MDNFFRKIKNKNIHIVGAFGAEGGAVLKFLAERGVKNITAHDFSSDKGELWRNFSKTHLWIKNKTERLREFEKTLKMPAKLNLKNNYLAGITEADLIFASSSWRLYKPNFPALQKAQDQGVEFSSLTKLYFHLAKGKIVSVTGTKGKGTTSRLIYEILAGADKKRAVCLAGNDRRVGQELNNIYEMEKNDILVLETSNRQLMMDLGRSPNIGVITNISPDHIDEHGSYENYIEVKKRLFRFSKKGDAAVVNYDNEITRRIGKDLIKRNLDVYFFSRGKIIKKGIFLEKNKIYVKIKKKEYIGDVSDIQLIGEHNIENVLAAAISAFLLGVRSEKIRQAIKTFRGLRQRIEFIGEYDGIKFYDDTASTNPDSTLAAVKSLASFKSSVLGSRLILVAGGDDKRMNYAGLAEGIVDKIDRLILLPGTGAENLKSQIESKKQKSKVAQDGLIINEKESLIEVLEWIKKQTKAGDIVLISPAGAHFQARYIDALKKSLRNLIAEKLGQ